MKQTEFRTIEGQITALGHHACHALVALDRLRLSSDPAMRLAYREVHDLIGDLAALRMTVDFLARPADLATGHPA